MAVLLHPTIDWQGWQKVKQNPAYKKLSPQGRSHTVNQLPQSLWTWEMSDNREIETLLEGFKPERKDK